MMMEQGSSLSRRDSQVRRAPNSAGLYDILDLILDKGIVIDAFVRVSLVGIELLTIDARVVIASVDTYLRYAEGAERLQLYNRSESQRLGEFIGGMGKRKLAETGIKTAGRLLGGGGKGRDEGEEDDEGESVAGRLADGVRSTFGRIVGKVTGGGGDDEGPDDDRGRKADRGQGSDRGERSERSERPRSNGHGKPAKAARR
jgi:hypothetical protein